MRVLVAGGRDFEDVDHFYRWMDELHRKHGISVVIEGGARGADKLAARWAKDMGIPIEEYPADWDRHGKRAGHIRNRQMLDEGKPDVVVTFRGGRGTANMAMQAREAGVTVLEPETMEVPETGALRGAIRKKPTDLPRLPKKEPLQYRPLGRNLDEVYENRQLENQREELVSKLRKEPTPREMKYWDSYHPADMPLVDFQNEVLDPGKKGLMIFGTANSGLASASFDVYWDETARTWRDDRGRPISKNEARLEITRQVMETPDSIELVHPYVRKAWELDTNPPVNEEELQQLRRTLERETPAPGQMNLPFDNPPGSTPPPPKPEPTPPAPPNPEPQPTSPGRVEYVDRVTPELVRNNPDKVYLFGDNLQSQGKGGQAVIRDEPNAIGIPTKKAPSMREGSFFTDDEFESNKRAIDDAIARIPPGKTIVIPRDGLGTGRARLETTAPETFRYLNQRLQGLSGSDPTPPVRQAPTPPASQAATPPAPRAAAPPAPRAATPFDPRPANAPDRPYTGLLRDPGEVEIGRAQRGEPSMRPQRRTGLVRPGPPRPGQPVPPSKRPWLLSFPRRKKLIAQGGVGFKQAPISPLRSINVGPLLGPTASTIDANPTGSLTERPVEKSGTVRPYGPEEGHPTLFDEGYVKRPEIEQPELPWRASPPEAIEPAPGQMRLPFNRGYDDLPQTPRISMEGRTEGGTSLVRTGQGDVDVMRANRGRSHMLNTRPGEPGWLGNPFKTESAGGQYTTEEATEKFRKALYDKLETDPEFKKEFMKLKGKRLGYFKPGASVSHARVIQEALDGTAAEVIEKPARKTKLPRDYMPSDPRVRRRYQILNGKLPDHPAMAYALSGSDWDPIPQPIQNPLGERGHSHVNVMPDGSTHVQPLSMHRTPEANREIRKLARPYESQSRKPGVAGRQDLKRGTERFQKNLERGAHSSNILNMVREAHPVALKFEREVARRLGEAFPPEQPMPWPEHMRMLMRDPNKHQALDEILFDSLQATQWADHKRGGRGSNVFQHYRKRYANNEPTEIIPSRWRGKSSIKLHPTYGARDAAEAIDALVIRATGGDIPGSKSWAKLREVLEVYDSPQLVRNTTLKELQSAMPPGTDLGRIAFQSSDGVVFHSGIIAAKQVSMLARSGQDIPVGWQRVQRSLEDIRGEPGTQRYPILKSGPRRLNYARRRPPEDRVVWQLGDANQAPTREPRPPGRPLVRRIAEEEGAIGEMIDQRTGEMVNRATAPGAGVPEFDPGDWQQDAVTEGLDRYTRQRAADRMSESQLRSLAELGARLRGYRNARSARRAGVQQNVLMSEGMKHYKQKLAVKDQKIRQEARRDFVPEVDEPEDVWDVFERETAMKKAWPRPTVKMPGGKTGLPVMGDPALSQNAGEIERRQVLKEMESEIEKAERRLERMSPENPDYETTARKVEDLTDQADQIKTFLKNFKGTIPSIALGMVVFPVIASIRDKVREVSGAA